MRDEWPIKVRFPAEKYSKTAPECPSLQHLGPVAHDRDPVQGRLPVEQNQVVVDHVPLHDVARFQFARDLFKSQGFHEKEQFYVKRTKRHLLLVSEPQKLLGFVPLEVGLHEVGARVDVGSVQHESRFTTRVQ